ncbi:cysteine-rich and transmembrane domain-containing protein 1 [Stegastes partitus]|uniref:Cysteine-rich and transmembrane domain-containing protein 1 n=1 Tax=Stegastes partitus TaxID=144197 RepID=A0A9Y4U0J2_9TELE|nr:PREDICTED: cysteine-rich and transmembrane domain-containing protein 1 [Stegastes partitus]
METRFSPASSPTVRMSADAPPPYRPHLSDVVPPALSSFPGGAPYQTFPQIYAGGGDYTYYHGHPGLTGPVPPGYQSGPVGLPVTPPKHTVYVVERHQDQDEDGGAASCLAALCCCCLLDVLADH